MGSLIGQFAHELGRVCGEVWEYVNNWLPWNSAKAVREYFSQEYFLMLWTMSIYFALILGGIWFTKKCCEVVLMNNRRFLRATTDCLLFVQLAMCAFGEYEIFQSYGYVAFFLAMVVNKTTSLLLNGKETNIYLVGEEFQKSLVPKDDAFLVMAAQLFGSGLSYFSSGILLRVVKLYTGMKWRDSECLLPGLLDHLTIVFLIELVIGFLLRYISICIDNRNCPRRIYFLPFVNAIFFTSTLYMVGIPGLDVTLGFSRVLGCVDFMDIGLIIVYFFIHLLPIFVGWYLHAQMIQKPTTLTSEWATITFEERLVEEEILEPIRGRGTEEVIASIPEEQRPIPTEAIEVFSSDGPPNVDAPERPSDESDIRGSKDDSSYLFPTIRQKVLRLRSSDGFSFIVTLEESTQSGRFKHLMKTAKSEIRINQFSSFILSIVLRWCQQNKDREFTMIDQYSLDSYDNNQIMSQSETQLVDLPRSTLEQVFCCALALDIPQLSLILMKLLSNSTHVSRTPIPPITNPPPPPVLLRAILADDQEREEIVEAEENLYQSIEEEMGMEESEVLLESEDSQFQD